MPRFRFALALAALTSALSAQAPPIAEWCFDSDSAQWFCLDPTGRVSTTTDVNIVGEAKGACLEFSYTPHLGIISGVATAVPGGLPGAQAVSFRMRTSEYALAAAVVAEADGSMYLCAFSSLPGLWHEAALSLSEFQLMDPTTDENGALDPSQVAAVGFADVIMLVKLAATQFPFIPPPDMGPRLMWLDDVRVESDPVPPRWEITQVDGVRAVRLDSFEAAPLQWLTLCGPDIEVAYDSDHKSHGQFSLRMTYTLPPGKVFGAMTPTLSAPLAGMHRLRMSLMSEAPVELLFELKERDQSKYQARIGLEAGNEFGDVELPLTDFILAEDSTDENSRLDVEEIREFLLADISSLSGSPAGPNTLWVDNVMMLE